MRKPLGNHVSRNHEEHTRHREIETKSRKPEEIMTKAQGKPLGNHEETINKSLANHEEMIRKSNEITWKS